MYFVYHFLFIFHCIIIVFTDCETNRNFTNKHESKYKIKKQLTEPLKSDLDTYFCNITNEINSLYSFTKNLYWHHQLNEDNVDYKYYFKQIKRYLPRHAGYFADYVTDWVYCKENKYFTGFSYEADLEDEKIENINKLTFYCSSLHPADHRNGMNEINVKYKHNPNGKTFRSELKSCHQLITGLGLSIESRKYSPFIGNSSMMTGISVECNYAATYKEPKIAMPQIWSDLYRCPENYGFCGFRVYYALRTVNDIDKRVLITFDVACCLLRNVEPSLYLFNERVTWWPSIITGSFINCKTYKYVKGFSLKMDSEKNRDSDYAGVTGVKFYCHKMEDPHSITSIQTNQGSWGEKYQCSSGYLVGIKTSIAPSVKEINDNAGVTNIIGRCENGEIIGKYLGPRYRLDEYNKTDSRIQHWVGYFLEPLECPPNTYVCSLRTEVVMGLSDRIGIHSLDIGCCD